MNGPGNVRSLELHACGSAGYLLLTSVLHAAPPTNLSFGDLAQQIFMPTIPLSIQAFAGETLRYVSGSNGSLEESATSRQDARCEAFPELRKVTLRLRP